MTDIRPFLTTLASPTPRGLGSALRLVEPARAPSPWAPPPTTPQLEAGELEALRDEARARGRAEGLAETEQLRAQARALSAELAAARDATMAGIARRIADVAIAVVAAWTERAPARELFEPIVRAWIERHAGPATARVAPAHVDVIRELVGETPITVIGDPSVRGVDLVLNSGTLELDHAWEPRLRELGEAITIALEEPA